MPVRPNKWLAKPKVDPNVAQSQLSFFFFEIFAQEQELIFKKFKNHVPYKRNA